MSFLKKAGLTAVFMIAADLVIASLTGFFGLHSLVVDGGAWLGDYLGIPEIDWGGLLEYFGIEWHGGHDHLAFEHTGYDHGILDHAGHDHGAFEHEIADIAPAPSPTATW